MPHSPRLFSTGAVTFDSTRVNVAEQEFLDDNDTKYELSYPRYRLGGGGGNLVQALHVLRKAFGTKIHVDFATVLGEMPENLSPEFQLRAVKNAHYQVRDLIKETKTQPIDLALEKENIIAHNEVVEHIDGRVILKSELPEQQAELDDDAEETIVREAKEADFVFADTRLLSAGVKALRVADDFNVQSMTDWGNKSWPKDQATAEESENLLRLAKIVAVPGDAVIKGMEDDENNPEKLFNTLRDDFGKENILMSDSSKDVRTLVDGVEYIIPAGEKVSPKFALAAGDTRNAGMIFYLLHNPEDVYGAMCFGTAVAAVKVKYPGMEWKNSIVEEVLYHPAMKLINPKNLEKLFSAEALNETVKNISFFPPVPPALKVAA